MPKGHYGFVLFVRRMDAYSNVWVSRYPSKKGYFIPSVSLEVAMVFRTRTRAEAVALLVAARNPSTIGQIEVQSYQDALLEVREC